jgi:hypothetical protein
VAVKAAHFARPPGLGLDGREHGDNIRVRRGSEYSLKTLQNLTKNTAHQTDFFNRCTWYLIPSRQLWGRLWPSMFRRGRPRSIWSRKSLVSYGASGGFAWLKPLPIGAG